MSFSLELVTASGYVVAGILFVIGLFNFQNRERSQQASTEAQNLITNLTQTTQLQETQIKTLQAKEIEQGKEIADLQGQLKTFIQVFQGRDPALQTFLASNPSERMEKLTAAVENLVKLLTPKTV